jgi:YidC/Oxa1 family membrane protein insertase
MQQQYRFILALVVSAAILVAWNYLFPPPKPPQVNPNANSQPVVASPQPSAQPTAAPSGQPGTQRETISADNNSHRKLRIVTPLYEATFDSRGAVATSWIIKKNRSNGQELYAASSTKNNRLPLELIPAAPEGISEEQLFQPLRVTTGDSSLDSVLAYKNFQIRGTAAGSESETIELPNGEKRVDFALHDDGTGLDATKSFTFYSDRYSVDVEVKLNRSTKAVPQARLAIGPSIGDQGIQNYTFYAVAPEGIAVAGGQGQRFVAAAIHKNEEGWFTSKRPEGADRQIVAGDVNWAGVGDTYFAMLAVPPQTTSGLEFRTVAYEHKANSKPEERYLIIGLMPVPTDGRKTILYVGPKDHKLLTAASEEIRDFGGPQVDLEQAINYGWLGGMRRFLAVPILFSIDKLKQLTGSYGVAIILFTIFIYSLFFPLKWQSSRKMKKAQKYAPRMKELQEKLKGMKQSDPRMKELQMEQLRLMKEANPLGGCLPLLIQMPFLFALYSALTISIDFRQAPFLWIPDLSTAEPYFLHFVRVLPVLFSASMIVLQLMTPAPSTDPLQRKMMAVGMPLFMLYILWSAPAGLLLYWLVGNIVGFSQQLLINRWTKSPDDEEPPAANKAKQRPPKKLSPAQA